MNRFKWETNDSFFFIDDEGIERFVQCPNEENGQTFKELGYQKIPMFKPEKLEKYHYYYNTEFIPKEETHQKLMTHYTRMRHMFNTKKIRNINDYLRNYFWIDSIGSQHDARYRIVLGFTYLHWKTIENLVDGELDIEDVDIEEIRKMLYTILPNGKTMLHLLVDKPSVLRFICNQVNPNDEEEEE